MSSLATLLLCLKHRACPRCRSDGKDRSRIRALGGNPETPAEPGQELLQYAVSLLHGGCSGQPEFRDQPVLQGSCRTPHPPLSLKRKSENHLDAQFFHCPSELGCRPAGLIFRAVLEDRVAVGVEGEGDAAAPEQVLHQQKVVAAVFPLAKQGLATAPLASSTASSNVSGGLSSLSHR